MFRFNKIKNIFPFLTSALLFTSCQKNETATTPETSASVIAVAASLSASGISAAGDSVYLVQACPLGTIRDSIAASQLPSAITDYLAANYPAKTLTKSFVIKSSSAVIGYVTVIYYNDKPVGLQFDASGNFIKVLEQRERGDVHGKGWHEGGRFDGRGHPLKDTIALANLPVTAVQYITKNYSADTLQKAFKNCDSSLVILSVNNGVFANVFSADGTFISRTELSAHGKGNCDGIAESDLPDAISTYLSTTYPGYTFKNAFAQELNAVVQNYIVFIDANNSKYSLVFDAGGNFVSVKTIR